MASPARAAARAWAAELHHGGLTRPIWPSWLAAFQLATLWLDRIQVERGKRTTRVLRDVIHEIVWRGKWLLDDRHAWQIGESAELSSRWVLESLSALEREGIAFRLHMVGVRSRKGLTSNVVVFPELLGLILDLVPRGVRAATIQFLRRTDVRAQLEAGGVWLRLPEAVTGAAPIAQRPSGITGTRVRGTGSQSVMGSGLSEIDRSQDLPTPAIPRDVENAGGAVAPSPLIAPSAASTVPELPSCATPPPAAGERQSGPRPVLPSPATLVSETRPSTVPPATQEAGAAGSRRESWPTLPVELRDPRLPDETRIAWYVAQGIPRPQAAHHVTKYRQIRYAQERLRAELGELPGRKPRWRRPARELEAIRRDQQHAVVEEGARALSLWTQLRGELARKASAPAWYDTLAHVRCERETLGASGEIVLHLQALREVRDAFEAERDRIEEIARTTLPVRVQLEWESKL